MRARISFSESETFFARELANALGASVGANRVNISPPPEGRDTPSAFRLLYEKSFLMDSAVIVIVVPPEVSPDESWVGSSLDRVSDVPAPIKERVVFVRSTKEGAAPLPTAAKQLDRSAPIEEIVEQLGQILAATDEEDRSARRMYYLRFMPDDGRSAYYFVRIGKDTEPEFLRAIKGKVVFNLEDYGKIIKSGYGEPSPELKQQMKERWNIKYGDEE